MVKLAVVGTGGMAHAHARSFQGIRGVKLVAACDVVPGKAAAFAKKFGIPQAFTDLKEMLATADIDAATNVTPDAAHAPVALAVIKAGKHILSEKPLATCYADAKKMADAARRKDVINMVNLSYRNSSAIHRAAKLVRQGAIGRVMHLEASYLQGWLGSKYWNDWRSSGGMLWRLSTEHGSKGVLGDLGVHIVDFASYPAGDIASVDCRLKTFHKAEGDRIGEYKLDANDSAVITVELKNGAIGTIHTTRWAVGQKNSLLLRLYGEKGGIIVDLDKSYGELQICRGKDAQNAVWRTIKCAATPNIYQRFIKSIRTGKNDQPDFARGAAIQKVLDACFESDQKGRAVSV